MKRILVVFLALALFVPAARAADGEVVAQVNGRGISRAEFDRNWNAFTRQRGLPQGHSPDSEAFKDLKREVLDLVVNHELLWQDAEKRKLTAAAADLDAEMEKVKGGYPSPEAFEKAIESVGLDEQELRNLIGRRMAVQRLVQEEVAAAVSVSDEEVKSYYDANAEQFKTPEEVRARHILVQVAKGADEAARKEARAKIDGILEQVRSGADFAELAKQNSDCPSNQKGGDLGRFGRGRMVKPFEDAAFALEPGQVSDVVETQFGYHIIKLEERMAAGTTPLEEIGPRIKDFLASQKINEAVDAYTEGLRAKADIKVLLDVE